MFDYTTHLRPRTRLVRRTIPIAIGTVLVAIAGLSLSGTVAASNSDERVQGCTLATLKGQYLFADAGTLLPPCGPTADAIGLGWISCLQWRRYGAQIS